MADPQSLISDPFAPAPGPRPFESGMLARPSSSLISDLSEPDRLQDAARRAPSQSPDTVARIFTLQRKTGLPKALIERNLDEVERQAAARDFNPETFRATSPLLASWLASDAGHLALAQDDLQPLGAMERMLSFGRRVLGDPAISLLKGAIALPEAGVGLADIPTLGRAGQLAERAGFQPGQAKAILSTFYSKAQAGAFASVQEADGALATAVAALSHPSVIAHSVLESLPLMLASVGAARVLPFLSPAIAGAVGEGAAQAGSAAEQSRQGTATGTLTGTQATLAASSGAVTGALGVFGGQLAARLGIADVETMLAGAATSATAQRGLVAQVLFGAVEEGFLEELPQSVSEQVHQNAADGRPLTEGVSQAAVLGAFAGAVMGGGANVGSWLTKFGETAAESKTFKRSPEKAEEWIAHATKDGPVETVHLPIAPAIQYWQSKGLDPATVATQLTGDPDAYRQALTTGEDLAVPFARYATQIAATEHNAFFAQEARFDPLAMNVREEAALSSQLSAQASQTPSEPSVATVGEQIRTELVDRFVAGGQMERSTAETNATVVQAFFDTFVQGRAGVDALALFAKRVGTVQRGTAPAEVTATFLAHSPGGPLYNLVGGAQHGSTVSAENLTAQGIDIPETPADTGERLSGDQLRARAIALASQAGPLGQEDLAALLAEPQTIRRLDRRRTQTDQPLAGLERRAATASVTPANAEFGDLPINVMENVGAAALRMLREDPTLKTRAQAMQAQAQATPRKTFGTLFQSTAPTEIEQTAAFDAWFGNSQVVEADGSPKVVYHGSNRAFDEFKLKPAMRNEGGPVEVTPAAFFFAEDKEPAQMFAEDRASIDEHLRGKDRGTPEVRSFYLSVQRPLDFRITPEVRQQMTEDGFNPNYNPNAPNPYALEILQQITDIGDGFWSDIHRALDDPAVIADLKDQGFDGIAMIEDEGWASWAVFDPTQIKSTENVGTFDPANPNVLRQDRRASVSFDASGKATISLFDKADLTSLMHELGGHVFLELYGDVVDTLAALDPATLTPEQARILEDYRTVILPFLGVDSRDAITRTQHEKWADAWEDYLMEGKAPSADLRSVFARMRAWFLHVYARLGRSVTLTDAVRGVMDRMLATDDAIAAAESEAQVAPLFVTAEDAGWSPAVFAAYQKDFARAGEQARDRVQQATMKELTREREAVWQAERTALRTEIAATVGERPAYRALTAIQKGTQPDGTPLAGGPMKLSKAALVAAKVNPETMKELRSRRLYSREGGLHPDVAAELFGYPSGEALVQTLSTTPPLAQTIDRETDAEMTARHGDRLLDGSIVAEARDAVMSVDGRAKVIAAEMRALAEKARAIGPALRAVKGEQRATVRAGRAVLAQVPSRKAIQTFAEQRIAGTTLGQLRPLRYFAAARTAANLALERVTAQDYEGALAAKIQHLLNLELYRAAVDAQADIEQARDAFGKMFRSDEEIGKTRNVDLVHAARAVASRYFFPTKADDVRTALDKVRTYDPDLYASLSDQIEAALSGGPDLKSLTVEGFIGMRDAVAALWAMARRTKQIVIDQQWVDRGVAEDALTARLDEVAPGTAVERTEGQMLLLGTRAALRRVESWADALDGGKADGVFKKYLSTPIVEAAARYRLAKNASLKSFLDLVQPIEKTLTQAKIAAPELNGHTFENLGGVLHALAHTGNASNLTKLIKGYGWGAVQADGTIDRTKWDAFVSRLIKAGTLTKAHYDFVQAVWDLNETLKPAAQKAHHDLYGYYFAEVTAAPFDTPFGSYRGGYIPAMVDPLKSPDAAIRQEQTDVLAGDNSFMFPTTGRGFTKTRVEAYAKPLLLDLRTLPQHLDKVLRFIHLEPAVKDVARLVRGRSFRARLDAFDPTAVKDLLNPWLQRAATQRVSQPATSWGGKAADRFFRTLRTRTGLNIMAANVVNTLQQFTGLSIAAVKVKPRYLRNALWSYVRGPRDLATSISDQSVFMSTLLGTQGIEIQQTIDDILLTPSPFETVRTFATKHGYFLQGATQNIVNLITWQGAYEQAMATAEAGQTEAQLQRSAVRQADSAVRLTQGTFAPEDVARFEAGTPRMRAFTMFSSYFNMLANTLGTEFNIIARDMGLRKGAGRALYVYTFGFMLPAVLSELIRQAIGGWDDDDDDTHLDEAMAIFFGSQARLLASLVPYVGQVGLALANTFNDKPYDDRLTTSPAISTIENAVRAPSEVYKAITEGTGTKRAIQDTLSAVGLSTGFPVQPLGRPLGYLGAMAEGTEQPADAVDLARGLITGRSQAR